MEIRVGERSYDVVDGRHDHFWARLNRGAWEPATFAAFDRGIRSDTLVIDIGAWIGPTVLYAAQLAKRCLAFEPDPVAFDQLQDNLARNASEPWHRRIETFPTAVTADGRPLRLGNRDEVGDSMSSSLFASADANWTVDAVRLHDVVGRELAGGTPVFVKIDIEGGEYELVPSIGELLANPLVTAIVSMHPAFLFEYVGGFGPEDQERRFTEAHECVLDALPWSSHRISFGTGDALSRAALVERIEQGHRPYELVIEPQEAADALD